MGGKKKVIIIGCGIGGSGAGTLLARDGFEVEIFERTGFIGGRFASYFKGDFKIDVGCHIIGNCDQGPLGAILDRVGEGERVKWSYTKKPGPTFIYGKERLKFPSGAAQLGFSQDDLAKIFQLYSDLAGMGDREFLELNSVDINTFLKRYLDDDRLRSIFAYLTGMYFVITDFITPTGEWARCQQEIVQKMASGYPIGGTGAIPEAFARVIEQNGGKVHLKRGAKRILIEGGRAQAGADIVISNADIKTTITELVGEERYEPAFVERVKAYEWSEGAFTVKVALDKKITDDKLIMYLDPENLIGEAMVIAQGGIPRKAPLLMIPVISNLDPTSCPEGCQLILAGTACRPPLDSPPEDWKKWEQAWMNALYDIFPDMEKHVLWVEHTSQKWINQMFGESGCVIGVAQSVTQVGPNRPPMVDPAVKNLYHCSADSGVHGIGGELAADAALRAHALVRES